MQFIKHTDIKNGDVIAWACDPSITCRASIIYYEVEEAEHINDNVTVVHGKSFGAGGERWKHADVKWDMAPTDRDILLISRE